MPKIFISYRREDSEHIAGRIHDRLISHFGRDAIFMDIDNIPFGVDFRKHLAEAVSQCDVLLAVIGDSWLQLRFKRGPKRKQRRLEDPADFVRIEIEAALARGIPVVPVLVGEALMPAQERLPESLKELAFRHAAEVRSGRDFHDHVDRLVRGIEHLSVQVRSDSASMSPQSEPSDSATPEPGDNDSIDVGIDLQMDFIRVPPGTFWMGGGGSSPGDKQVTIEQGFELGTYQVTQDQWQAVMGSNPSYFSRTGGGKDKVRDIPDADLRLFPIEQVSWEDVDRFLAKLNKRAQAGGWLYRLPTMAEWEYACRGAATSKEECSFHFYFDELTNDLSSEQANFDGNHPDGAASKGPYLERTTRVGSYRPNRLGLYDMHGNVWEWCSDWDVEGSTRMLRGGSWGILGSHCRAAKCYWSEPQDRHTYVGFRLVRVPFRG
jgi:formylglycine-generating enzyme required for sulfatase activity